MQEELNLAMKKLAAVERHKFWWGLRKQVRIDTGWVSQPNIRTADLLRQSGSHQRKPNKA